MAALRLTFPGAALLAAGAAVHAAEPYPARAVRLAIPFPPSGSNDIIGRFVARHLGDRLGRHAQAELAKWARVAKAAGVRADQ